MLTILSIYPFAGVELESIPQNCMQLVKVFDVKGSSARLARFDRDDNGTWRPNSEVWSVNIGKNGIGKESEGDGKTPSGSYFIEEVYGYEDIETKMPFFISDREMICVDDSDSRYYNLVVDSSRVKKDYKSFEYMKREDDLYAVVVTIGYNKKRHPMKGSCIFFHIANGKKPTAGCIAMTKKEMMEFVKWLDPKKSPAVLIVK